MKARAVRRGDDRRTARTTAKRIDATASGFAGSASLLLGLAVMSLLYAPQPLLALISEDTGRSATEANLVLSASTFGIALGVFPTAWISERFGRRPTILTALLLAGLWTAVTAFSGPWWLLVLSRVAVGFAIAAVLVSALAWVREFSPSAAAPHASALYVAGTSLGGMFGRVFAGVVAESLGWRFALLVTDGVVGLFAAFAVAFALRAGRRLAAERTTAGVRGGAMPAAPRTTVTALIVIGFLSTTTYVGMFSAISFRMLAPPFHLGVAAASLLFLCYGAGTVSAAQTGRLLQRIGLRWVVIAAAAVALAAVALSAIDVLATVIVAMCLLSAGFFVIHTAATTTIVMIARRPTASTAWYTLWYYAGASAGALLAGAAWDLGGWLLVGAASAVPLVAVGVLGLVLPRRVVRPPNPVDAASAPVSSDPIPLEPKEHPR